MTLYAIRQFHDGDQPASPLITTVTQAASAAINGHLRCGQYLESFDADAMRGRGLVAWTDDPQKAKLFASFGNAHEFYRTQSKTHPLRDDGKPNRPLTAYNVTIVQINPYQND
jgi:hypothetical protein